jgi:hypothetical protein
MNKNQTMKRENIGRDDTGAAGRKSTPRGHRKVALVWRVRGQAAFNASQRRAIPSPDPPQRLADLSTLR